MKSMNLEKVLDRRNKKVPSCVILLTLDSFYFSRILKQSNTVIIINSELLNWASPPPPPPPPPPPLVSATGRTELRRTQLKLIESTYGTCLITEHSYGGRVSFGLENNTSAPSSGNMARIPYVWAISNPIDCSCWKAKLNKFVAELWYLHKHETEDSVNLQYNIM
jgi:hypothetical protein